MANAEIRNKLTTILRTVFDDDGLIVTPELSADDVDGWDSLSHLRLVLSVEKAFKIKFTAAEVSKLKNVGELQSLVVSKL
jgi:acyl carrier protein